MTEEQEQVSTDVQIIEGQPVMMIEGEIVSLMEGKLPSVTVVLPEGYRRGTHLRMNVEFVVKGWSMADRKGEPVRVHQLGLESAQMVVAFAPEEARDDVGGSASGQPTQTAEEAEELGVTFGRTSDTWDGRASA